MRASAKSFTEIKGIKRKVKVLYDDMKGTRMSVKGSVGDKKEL